MSDILQANPSIESKTQNIKKEVLKKVLNILQKEDKSKQKSQSIVNYLQKFLENRTPQKEEALSAAIKETINHFKNEGITEENILKWIKEGGEETTEDKKTKEHLNPNSPEVILQKLGIKFSSDEINFPSGYTLKLDLGVFSIKQNNSGEIIISNKVSKISINPKTGSIIISEKGIPEYQTNISKIDEKWLEKRSKQLDIKAKPLWNELDKSLGIKVLNSGEIKFPNGQSLFFGEGLKLHPSKNKNKIILTIIETKNDSNPEEETGDTSEFEKDIEGFQISIDLNTKELVMKTTSKELYRANIQNFNQKKFFESFTSMAYKKNQKEIPQDKKHPLRKLFRGFEDRLEMDKPQDYFSPRKGRDMTPEGENGHFDGNIVINENKINKNENEWNGYIDLIDHFPVRKNAAIDSTFANEYTHKALFELGLNTSKTENSLKDFNYPPGFPKFKNNLEIHEFLSDVASVSIDMRDIFRIIGNTYKPYRVSRKFAENRIRGQLKTYSQKDRRNFTEKVKDGNLIDNAFESMKWGIGPEHLKSIQADYMKMGQSIINYLKSKGTLE